MEKIYNTILSAEDIDYLTQHEETVSAKAKLDSLDVVHFSIELTESIQKVLQEQFGLTISSVPMRWIKGDTPEHTDHSCVEFEHTYLIYLTNSVGEFVLDTTSYEIVKNTAFKFNEGIAHKTINTGTIPRLLLGPMNEFGVSVGDITPIMEYIDTDQATPLGVSTNYTIGIIVFGDLKGYTQWKILNTDNPTINTNIVYSNGTTLPATDDGTTLPATDDGITYFSYTLYAYVPPPPAPVMSFSMTSLFSNNAQVYYKPHSLASGGTAGVKNSRIKARKT